jgi:hypothetical protein
MPKPDNWGDERIHKLLRPLERRIAVIESASQASVPSASGDTFMLVFAYDTASLSRRFVDFAGANEQTPYAFEAGQRIPILVDCTLVSVGYISDVAGGVTIAALHINDVIDSGATDTQTVAAQTVTIFTLNQTFVEGDEFALSIDPATAPQSVTGTVRFQVT